MVTLSEAELDGLASSSTSIHLTFFGIGFGALLTSLVVLSTVDITNAKIFAAYVAGTIVAGLATAYFGVRAVSDYFAVKTQLKSFKG